jgi:hypothetical protein
MRIAAVVLSACWWPQDATALERRAVGEPPRAECVAHWTEARFVAFGYHHIVHIANGCSVPVSCSVRTNVNPDAQAVTVPSGASIEVVTFIGSPAREFVATVQCVQQPVAPS